MLLAGFLSAPTALLLGVMGLLAVGVMSWVSWWWVSCLLLGVVSCWVSCPGSLGGGSLGAGCHVSCCVSCPVVCRVLLGVVSWVSCPGSLGAGSLGAGCHGAGCRVPLVIFGIPAPLTLTGVFKRST